MRIIEIGTGYTSIPARIGAATEIVVEELTKAFLCNGQPVEVIDIEDSTRAYNELNINEVKVPFLGTRTDEKLGFFHKLRRVSYSICLALKLRKTLRKTDEKVCLHFHNQYNLFFFLMLVPKYLRKKAYIAYTVHSHIWHNAWEDAKSTIRRRYFQECVCVKKADGVFVLNETTKDNIVNRLGVDTERVHLINNGVNTDIYHPVSEHAKESIKQKYGVGGKKIYTLVGSVCERKNQLQAIQMLLPLMKQDKTIAFCYAGGIVSDEYQKSISEFSEKMGISQQVIYFGEIEPGANLNEFYAMSDAMVFPSKAEGFSLVILEAMSAGIPVIVPDYLNFQLSDECIRYRDEEEFESLVKKIVLNENKRNELSIHVRDIILSNYSWSKIANEYLMEWNR